MTSGRLLLLSETQFPHLKNENATDPVMVLFLELCENIDHYGSRKGSVTNRYHCGYIIIITIASSLTGEKKVGRGPTGPSGWAACQHALPSTLGQSALLPRP